MSEYTPGYTPGVDLRSFVDDELQQIAIHISRNRWEYSFEHVDASKTVGPIPFVFADASGGAITLTLPEPSGDPMLINIKKTDSSANAVTIAATSIDGLATQTLSLQYESMTLFWDKSVWHIV